MNSQLNRRSLWPLDSRHLDVVRVVDEGLGDCFHQLFHSGASFSGAGFVSTNPHPIPLPGTQRNASLDAEPPDLARGSQKKCPEISMRGLRCDYAIFCNLRKLRTVSLGCAP